MRVIGWCELVLRMSLVLMVCLLVGVICISIWCLLLVLMILMMCCVGCSVLVGW